MYKSLFTMFQTITFNSIFDSIEANISITDSIVMIFAALLLGLFMSFIYTKTGENTKQSRNFAVTMTLLPAIISSIILLIGSDIARAFSLAGAFSIIRFRSEPGQPRDIAYILFSMGAGLALGIGEYAFAILFTLVLSIAMTILTKTKYASKSVLSKQLKITIPEDLNYEKELKEVFEKYKVTYYLKQVKTTSLGSLYQLYYDVVLNDDVKTQEFMDDLRIKNSNLDISLSLKLD